jgi:hypothetical protein
MDQSESVGRSRRGSFGDFALEDIAGYADHPSCGRVWPAWSDQEKGFGLERADEGEQLDGVLSW